MSQEDNRANSGTNSQETISILTRDVERKEKSKWTRDEEILLQEWSEEILGYAWLHERSSKYYQKQYMLLNIPAIALSAGTGIIIFSDIQPSSIIKLVNGSVSWLAGALVSLQSYFKFEKKAEQHFQMYKLHTAHYHYIQSQLILPPDDRIEPTELIQKIKKGMDDIIGSSPEIPITISRQFYAENKHSPFSKPFVVGKLMAFLKNKSGIIKKEVISKPTVNISNSIKSYNQSNSSILPISPTSVQTAPTIPTIHSPIPSNITVTTKNSSPAQSINLENSPKESKNQTQAINREDVMNLSVTREQDKNQAIYNLVDDQIKSSKNLRDVIQTLEIFNNLQKKNNTPLLTPNLQSIPTIPINKINKTNQINLTNSINQTNPVNQITPTNQTNDVRIDIPSINPGTIYQILSINKTNPSPESSSLNSSTNTTPILQSLPTVPNIDVMPISQSSSSCSNKSSSQIISRSSSRLWLHSPKSSRSNTSRSIIKIPSPVLLSVNNNENNSIIPAISANPVDYTPAEIPANPVDNTPANPVNPVDYTPAEIPTNPAEIPTNPVEIPANPVDYTPANPVNPVDYTPANPVEIPANPVNPVDYTPANPIEISANPVDYTPAETPANPVDNTPANPANPVDYTPANPVDYSADNS